MEIVSQYKIHDYEIITKQVPKGIILSYLELIRAMQ